MRDLDLVHVVKRPEFRVLREFHESYVQMVELKRRINLNVISGTSTRRRFFEETKKFFGVFFANS